MGVRGHDNTLHMVESGNYLYHCANWSIRWAKDRWVSPYQPKPRWGLVKTEGEFYDRTTTPDCSADRRAVPSVVKTESELCVCMCFHAPHTHIRRTAKLSDKTHKHWIHSHYLRKPISIELSQQTQHCIPSIEVHYSNSCQQFSAHIYSTHALTVLTRNYAPLWL